MIPLRNSRYFRRWLAVALTALTSLYVTQAGAITVVTLNQQAYTTPAVAVFNNQVILAWTGTDSNHHLNTAASADGLHFGSARGVSGNTSFAGPGLAAFNGHLFIAWGGGGNDINIAYSSDGANFGNQYVLTIGGVTQRTVASPALGVANGLLYLAWINQDAARSVYRSYSTDGINWSPPQASTFAGQGSPYSPALTGSGSPIQLVYATYTNGVLYDVVSNPGQIGVTPSTGPGLTYFNSQLIVALNQNWYACYVNSLGGWNCGAGGIHGQGVYGNPALTTFSNHVFMYWAGTDSNHDLNAGVLE